MGSPHRDATRGGNPLRGCARFPRHTPALPCSDSGPALWLVRRVCREVCVCSHPLAERGVPGWSLGTACIPGSHLSQSAHSEQIFNFIKNDSPDRPVCMHARSVPLLSPCGVSGAANEDERFDPESTDLSQTLMRSAEEEGAGMGRDWPRKSYSSAKSPNSTVDTECALLGEKRMPRGNLQASMQLFAEDARKLFSILLPTQDSDCGERLSPTRGGRWQGGTGARSDVSAKIRRRMPVAAANCRRLERSRPVRRFNGKGWKSAL